MKKNSPIFISSSGRSGSTSIVEALSKIENVSAHHGPKNKHFERINCLRYLEKRGEPGVDSDQVIAKLKKYRDPLIRQVASEGQVYIESSWFISAILPELVQLYPDAKIIHLVRDGRDFVRSGMNRFWFSGKKSDLKRVGIWTRDKWGPPASCKTRFQKICWLWAEQQRVMQAGLKRIPSKNNFGVVRFEDLIVNGLDEFINKLDINGKTGVTMQALNKTKKNFLIPHWREWDPKMAAEAKRHMGAELELFRYRWM